MLMIRFSCRLLVAASLLVASATAGHTEWRYYGGSPQHTGVSGEPLAPPLSVVWKYAAIVQKPEANTTSPVVVGNTVYFVATDRVYAVRADTGELIWKTPSGDQPGPTTYHSTPVVTNDTVYVGAANGHMYALDARNGAQKWEFITGAPIRSHPLVEDNTLYFGSDDDYFYAIDASTAELRWKYHATADVESAATFAPDSTELIYFSSSDGHLYGLNRTTGRLKWSARTTAASGGNSPVAFQNALYLAAGSQIFSFRTRSGVAESLIQATPAEVPEADITCTPIFASDPHGDPTQPVVFFGDRAGNFYCYQKSRLYWKRVWKQSLDGGVSAMPVMAGNLIFAAANKGFIYALNVMDGSILWQYHTQATLDLQTQYKYFNMDSPLVISDGHLLVLGDDGALNVFGRSESWD
jgi:outer membrane protein assembly factor BamB